MDFIRRLGALVMTLLVLQLSVGGGRSQCDDLGVATETSHAGMSMPSQTESCGDAAGSDCTSTEHGACQTMMSCLVAVFQPATQSQLPVALAREVAAISPATLFQARSTVPDLPPPRA